MLPAWKRSHLIPPSLFFSYWEDLKCQFLPLFFLCHSKSIWAHLRRASHSVAFRQVELCPTRNLLSPSLLPQTLYLPFGMLSNPSIQPLPYPLPTPQMYGGDQMSQRAPAFPSTELFWGSGWVRISGRHQRIPENVGPSYWLAGYFFHGTAWDWAARVGRTC